MITEVDQVEVNGLIMGPGTPYHIVQFNPFVRSTRHTQTDRAWAPGSWSGREDTEAVSIPLRLYIKTVDAGAWLAAEQALASAMRPSLSDVELRWKIGATEYLMRVRPRLVEPDTDDVVRGTGPVGCALMALDPTVYAATLSQQTTGLPSSTGGLGFPIQFPVQFDAVTTSGTVLLTNAGTADTGLLLRIDGPAVQPRVSLTNLTDPADIKTLRFNLTVESGQWLSIDTAARTVSLNAVASRRGQTAGQWPLLPPGSHELSWSSDAYNAGAMLTASWRSAWF